MTNSENQEVVVSYQMAVPATWSKTFVDGTVKVYGYRPGEIPEVVSTGRCRQRAHGEPFAVRVEGWEAGLDWDKLNSGMGPGEWVCTPVWVGDGPAPVPPQAR